MHADFFVQLVVIRDNPGLKDFHTDFTQEISHYS